MSAKSTAFSRIGFAVLVVSLALACRPPADAREARDFERMRQQQRYDSYEPSRFFANGAVLQAPPAHTIARSAAYSSAAKPATPAFLTGRTDTTAVTSIPIAIDERLLALGARQFAISCAPCHGAGGFGGGPVAANILPHRPPSLRTAPVTTLPPGMLFSVITQGFGQMPPYGWQMPPETRWAVVAYVRALSAQPMTAETRADSLQAEDIRHVDSLRASGASLEQIAKQPEHE